MSGATFGDLLGQAEGYLQAALADPGRQDTEQAAAVENLWRLVTSLGRYLDDLAAGDVIEAVSQTDLHPWIRAAADARAALHQVGNYLAQAMAITASPSSGPPDSTTQALAAAAVLLTAGRDLLHTHLATTSDGLRTWRSEWAPVLASPTITRAVTEQASHWARRLIPLTVGLASASPPEAAAVRDALQSAAQWLGAVSAAVRPARAADPVTLGDLRLLHAIPAAQAPPRVPPHDDETMAELCVGITISAQRLRAALITPHDHARISPSAGADAWRWAARATAVTGHASEHALRTLARHSAPGSRPLDASQLHAAEAVAVAWRSWRQVSLAWTDLTTEPARRPPPAAIEIGDLLLRIGRLAHADPRWTPALSRDSHPGDPAALAAIAPDVIGAVHQAIDALAQSATADLQAVTLAARGRRLYVPTRTLPARYDVPRPYAPAPPNRFQPLLDAYRIARDASLHAADTLATLAIALDAASSTLALARAAVQPQPGRRLADQPRESAIGTAPDGQPDAREVTRGPVEHAVRSLKVTDPIMLLRAAAIDAAAQTLIAQAEGSSSHPGPQIDDAATTAPPLPGTAARLAAKDNPQLLLRRQASREDDSHAKARPQRHGPRRDARPSRARHPS